MIHLKDEDIQRSDPLEWGPLWDTMAHYELTNKWIRTTHEMFSEMLNALPPRSTHEQAFLVGEPHHDNGDGETVYAAFCKASDGAYYARYLTFRKFREICHSGSNN